MAKRFEITGVDDSRRRLLRWFSALPVLTLAGSLTRGAEAERISKVIPSSGEQLPVIGMGTSRTFDVSPDDAAMMAQLRSVLQAFFAAGGGLIDSSPMYGRAEQVTGELLRDLGHPDTLFAATKVWTDGRQSGVEQMQESFSLLGVKVMDLMQIHNLRDWQVHLKTLRAMKEQGSLRYIGITTSHGRSHAELEQLLQREPLDFVQLSYNILDRAVEQRLLPLARERGVAVLVNRPYQRGQLFARVKGTALPDWAKEFGCQSWGQFFLKYVVSHPAVTCAIPATSKVHHMVDNMGAGVGRLPHAGQRRRMEQMIEGL